MRISVVICAFTDERWEELRAAVASCENQSRPPEEIIVVIDYNEALLARATREFSRVLVTSNSSIQGLSGSRNTGVVAATGDVIAFLDDDAFADGDWLAHLETSFSDEHVAGAGGWIVPEWPGEAPAWFPTSFLWVFGCSYDGLPPSGGEIRNPIGSNMALRRRVFDAVGGFTPGIGRIGKVPLGGEETELCIRYTADFPADCFVLNREALVHHRVPAERLTWHYFWTRCWAEGLSKGVIARRVGASASLSSERGHVMVAIPRDVARSVALLRRDVSSALRRLALIVAGSACAVAGVAWATTASRRRLPLDPTTGNASETSDGGATISSTSPIIRMQVDVADLAREVPVAAPTGARVWVEAVQRGQVVGVIEALVNDGGISAGDRRDLAAHSAGIVPLAVESFPSELLPRASVVVSTICEAPRELVDTVTSLLALDYPDFEVIIIDNRVDPTEPLPSFVSDPRLHVGVERRPGVSSGRNRGIAEATGEIVAFTDDDVVVERTWLRALGVRFALEANLEAVGGLVLPRELDTPAQLWFEEYYGGFTRGFRSQTMSMGHHEDDELFPYSPRSFGAGLNMAFRREALERIGGFDPALGIGTPSRGGEDVALFIALVLAGGTVGFEPAALVRHHHRRTKREFLVQLWDYGVGLSAMLCAVIARDPTQARPILRRVPYGVRHFLRPRRERSVRHAPGYPRYAVLIQLFGMLYGPLAYAASRARRHRRAPS